MYPWDATQAIDAILNTLLGLTVDIVTLSPKRNQTPRIIVRMERNLDPDGKQEHEESIVVLNTHTIINPRAMVIEPFNTLVANRTMP